MSTCFSDKQLFIIDVNIPPVHLNLAYLKCFHEYSDIK